MVIKTRLGSGVLLRRITCKVRTVLVRSYEVKICAKCGKPITGHEYEVEIYEDETPEAPVKGIKVICEDCFEELGALWIGF